MPICPECGSPKLWRAGIRYLSNGGTGQRWLCRDCGLRFSESEIKLDVAGEVSEGFHSAQDNNEVRVVSGDFSVEKTINRSPFSGSKDVTSHETSTVEERLNNLPFYNRSNQVCAKKGAKNLRPQQTETKAKAVAGERIATSKLNEIKAAPQIEKLLVQVKGDGRTDGTVLNYRKTLKCLLKAGADLFDPSNTKLVLANLKRGDGTPYGNNTKKTMAAILNVWYDFLGIKWKRPNYVKVSKPIYVPPTGLLQQFTAALGKKMCCYCMLMMETGARCGEIANLEMKDFDFTQQKVSITPEKGSNPRTLRIMHPEVLEMVKKLPPNQNPLRKNKLFANADDVRSNFYVQRKRAARKFQNPDMLKIHFHTYRHWKATTAQRMLKDIFEVQAILGHKNCESTRKYIDMAKAYGDSTYDEYETRVADTMEEAQKLVEVGFEYHMEIEGHKLLRRKKAYNGLSW